MRLGPGGLAGALRDLRNEGCHNWNLVSPTPWLPMIRAAVAAVERDGLRLPVIYNTSGYERAETLAACAGLVDIYLADLRYACGGSALEGSGVADYVTVARDALREMWRLAGPLELDAEGIARRGTICRVLVLPGRADEAVMSLRWLAQTLGTDVAVSVMGQYVPAFRALEMPGWNRGVTREEYDPVRREVDRLGFETGWIQELNAGTPGELLGCDMKPGADLAESGGIRP